MSDILNVENDAVYEGYDSVSATRWCSPNFLGNSVCASASAVAGQVSFALTINTPIGSASKTFQFNTNLRFEWQPFSRFKVAVSIADLNESRGTFRFVAGLELSIQVPALGWKTVAFKHTFEAQPYLAGVHNEMNDSQFSSLLALHASGGLNDDCKCDGKDNLFKGDIYNNYLNSQAAAGFPTLPLNQCIPTGQCIPTITTCMTGISPFCLAQQAGTALNSGLQANAANTFPTVPVHQCFPTFIICVTGISPICLAQQGGQQAGAAAGSGLQSNPANAFPTLPLNQCLPTGQCIQTITSCITGISPFCFAQQEEQQPVAAAGSGSQAVAANAFPTLPVNVCFPTGQCFPTITSCMTGISPICLAQQGEGQQPNAAITVPSQVISQCTPFTFPVVCPIQQDHKGQLSGANIPTLPVVSCVPSVACIPTVKCIPTVSCTGIPYIC